MSTPKRKLKFNQAISEAFIQAMEQDQNVIIAGEGVDDHGGIFGTTRAAFLKFGHTRVFDMPLSENMIAGAGFGASLGGLRPVLVFARNDFLLLAMDQIVNHIAKWSYIQQGKTKTPLLFRALIGRGWGQGAQHSQSLQALFAHIPGLKVIMPSTPYLVKGLITSSIFGQDPVISIEHRSLYNLEEDVPENSYTVPLGKGFIHLPGNDITVIATSFMVQEALHAAAILAKENISLEVIDPVSLRPLDEALIISSAKKTGRVIVADTGTRTFGVTAEITAVIIEQAFSYLKGPVARIGLPDTPTPASPELEKHYYPGSAEIITAARKLLKQKSGGAGNKKSFYEENIIFKGPF